MEKYEKELQKCSEILLAKVNRILVAGKFSVECVENAKGYIAANYKKHLKTEHAKMYYAPVLAYDEDSVYIGWKDLQAK